MATIRKSSAQRQREYRQRTIARIEELERVNFYAKRVARTALAAAAAGRINLPTCDPQSDVQILGALEDALSGKGGTPIT